MNARRIIHIDLDAFYASVEQLDNLSLRGKPIAVGGMPESRGVVATCSYEARKFGVHSAMPSARAKVLCPELIFIQPRIARYKEISLKVQSLFNETTPIFEMLSLDEAYLDVTSLCLEGPQAYARDIAMNLKNRIEREIGITASAGVGPSKLVAKIASDVRKPNGLKVVAPSEVLSFLGVLPVQKLWGVGPVRQKMLNGLGYRRIEDLRNCSEESLFSTLGTYGFYLRSLAMGIDARPVDIDQPYKSRSIETTFSKDETNHNVLISCIENWSKDIWQWMQKREMFSRTVVLKLRDQHFKTITRSFSGTSFLGSADTIELHGKALLEKVITSDFSVRLLGLGVSSLQDKSTLRQLNLF